MLKGITKIDILREAQRCVERDEKLREHIRLDLAEDADSGADFDFVILSDVPFNWEMWDRVQELVYDCLEKFDPYITLHFDWKKI